MSNGADLPFPPSKPQPKDSFVAGGIQAVMEADDAGKKCNYALSELEQDVPQSLSACDLCRAKKYRCSKDRPTCLTCLQHDKQCHYSPQIVRSPLTRAHLTRVEERLRKFEAVFARLLPHVDVEGALSSSALSQLATQITNSKYLDGVSANEGTNDVPKEGQSEALPHEANGFDWKEEERDVQGLSDGMAALAIEPSGVGYLGPTSAVVFLRSLLPWITSALSFPRSPSEPFLPHQTIGHIPLPVFQGPEEVPSPQLVSYLIDSYFANYHTVYPFVHEATFRAQHSGLVKRPEKLAWHMLFNAILALGAWTSGNDTSDLDDIFYRKAVSLGQEQSILESGSLPLVQALLLLSNHAQKRNKPNTGWNLLGLAVRMALGLGLHRELPEWDISLLQREMRRRVWWGVFVFDSGASLTFGRPALLPDVETSDVKQVLNIPDELLTGLTETVPSLVDEPTRYSSLIALATFHQAANGVLRRLLSSPNLSAGEALALNAVMIRWTATLPWYFQLDQFAVSPCDWYLFARSRLRWKFWNLQITLTRPFLRHWLSRCMEAREKWDGDSEENECRSLCIDCAHRTIDSIGKYIRENPLTRVASWYALYFMFHAALIVAVCLCVDPTSPEAPIWTKDLDTTRLALSVEFSENKLAPRCLAILDGLRPHPTSSDDALHFMPFYDNAAMGGMSFWPLHAADAVNTMSWPAFGLDFP